MFNKDKYFCSKEQRCEIIPGKRNQCAFCRYQKCIQLGMSVEGLYCSYISHCEQLALDFPGLSGPVPTSKVINV